MAESVEELDKKILELKEQLVKARRALPPETIGDYVFRDWNDRDVHLADLFGSKNELIIIHNMGRHCAYCTLWADGFNGLVSHLNDRSAFAVINNDPIDQQKDFAQSRGWRFKIVSAKGSTFVKDMGFEPEPKKYWPGASAFHKAADGIITRSAKTFFGPGDDYCSVWHLFDLLNDGPGDWRPRLNY